MRTDINKSLVMKYSRKTFIGATAPLALSLAIPGLARQALRGLTTSVRIGVLTDLHHDIMHDGPARLQSFISDMHARKPDAIAQLGDFCYPNERNKPVIDAFNSTHATRLHVIGNHDTDGGYTHAQCVSGFGMPATYYSMVIKGIRFIVLNGNEAGSPSHKGGYPAYIGPAQASWLKDQLAGSTGPVIILCHQPLTGYLAIDNSPEILQIISAAVDRVLLVVNGHTHLDGVTMIDDIPHLTINSASYYWVGKSFKHNSYSEVVHRSHEWIAYTCPYKDPLFTTLEIDPQSSVIRVTGKRSEWMGPSPAALGYTYPAAFAIAKQVVPRISPQKLAPKTNTI